MTGSRWRLFATPLLAAALTACPGFGDEEPAGHFTEVPAFPTYEQHVKVILDDECVECHSATPTNGAPSSIRMDVYDNVGSVLGAGTLSSRIVTRSVDSPANPMPPTSRAPVGAIDKAILEKWHELGAPRNADDITNNGMDAGNNGGSLSFEADLLPIFNRYACTVCHGVGLQQGNHRLDTLENLMTTGDNAPAVIPCDSGASPLVLKLRSATLPYGELMPQGGPEIAQADLDTIAMWIDQGAESGMACASNNGNNGDMDAGMDADMDATNNGAPGPVGQKRNFSGRYFVAMASPSVPAGPLFFKLEAIVASDLSTIDFTVQALAADRAAMPRTPVGAVREVMDVPFGSDGTFFIEVGRVMLGGDANPAADAPLDLSLTIQGYVCGGEQICGFVDGQLFAPAEADLEGSTFGGFVSTHFESVIPATSCQRGWCEGPAANNGNNGDMDAGMDVEPDVPDMITHPVAHPSFEDVADVFASGRCLGCHGSLGGLSLRSFSDTLAGGDSGAVVVACEPDDSLLIQKLRTSTLTSGSLMPLGGPEIPDAQLETLRNWIADGATQTYTPNTCP